MDFMIFMISLNSRGNRLMAKLRNTKFEENSSKIYLIIVGMWLDKSKKLGLNFGIFKCTGK